MEYNEAHMATNTIPQEHLQSILKSQKNEITEYHIYTRLAQLLPNEKNRRILNKIAQDEKSHYDFWKTYTRRDVGPSRIKIFIYLLISRLLGFTFAVKLMEKGEELAQVNYEQISEYVPHAKEIEKEEKKHETSLLEMLDEERLRYVGSMILGVNDALVELTGALAGFTLALQNTKIIAMTGLITGIAASLSMAASEYLSTKAEKHGKDPIKASLYTGSMYVCTVLVLISPYFIFANVFVALASALILAMFIILFFTFYISIAQDQPFKSRFLEMAGISLGVSTLTFIIGYLVRILLGISI